MSKSVLYGSLAGFYDLLYNQKDSIREARRIKALIHRYKESPGNALLDVGCGTGSHLQHLVDEFSCTGIDINGPMLEMARRKVRGAHFIKADMASFKLRKRFDSIICMFGTIGYAKDRRALERTIRNLSGHLKVGGVALIEPWIPGPLLDSGRPSMQTYDGRNIKIARLSMMKRRGNLSVWDAHYLIVERDLPVKHFVERHEMGLFTIEEMCGAMEGAGLRVRCLRRGISYSWGILVGVRIGRVVE